MSVLSNVKKLAENTNLNKRNLHLTRDCEVFIIKNVKAANISSFLEVYDEFIQKKMFVKISDLSNDYITKYAFQTNSLGKNNPKDFKNLEGITDVVSINANPSTEAIGSANIVLKNINYKYEFVDYDLKKGQSVFSPMDEVILKLPGLDGKLYEVFTGTISTANPMSSDGGKDNFINISIEDEMKKLRINRTNIRPSLNAREATTAIIAYQNIYTDKKAHEAFQDMLGRTFIDFDSDESVQNQFASIDSQTEAVDAGDTGADLKDTTASKALLKDDVIKASISSFLYSIPTDAAATTEQIGTAGQRLPSTTQNESRVPTEIWGFSSRDVPESDVEILLANDAMQITTFKAENLKFIISGTNQPPFLLAFNKAGPSFWESEFKDNYSLIQQIAKEVFFECFADERGVVHVRPLNIALPGDATRREGRVGPEYQIDDLHIIADNIIETDNGAVSLIYVRGNFKFDNAGETGWKVNAVYDNKVFQKYGWRVAPQVTIIGATDYESLARYGFAILTRMNKYIDSGSITIKGDARLSIGNPVYLKRRRKIYYIRSISHDYVPGSHYNMTLDLVYGRSPLCYTDKAGKRKSNEYAVEGKFKLSNIARRNSFSNFINNPNNNLDTNVIYSTAEDSNVLQSQKTRIQANVENLSFGDYVWEDLSELNYDDLVGDRTRQIRRAPFYRQLGVDVKLQGNAFIEFIKEQIKKYVGLAYTKVLQKAITEKISDIKDKIK